MNVIFDAVYTRWAATMGALTLDIGQAIPSNPAGTGTIVYPYASVNIIANTSEDTFTEDIEVYLVQFDIVSEDTLVTEIGTLFETLKSAFDKHRLAIVGYTTISLDRVGAPLTQVDLRWHYVVTYRLMVQKD